MVEPSRESVFLLAAHLKAKPVEWWAEQFPGRAIWQTPGRIGEEPAKLLFTPFSSPAA